MGRVKLKIKRLESTSSRQVTYSKRRGGILKKAKELSILCDIDILLLMCSPTGRPTIFHGNRSIEEVISKFAQLTPQERAKRKLESLEALKKTFKKLDHDVNIEDFLGGSTQTVEELTNQIQELQSRLADSHTRLSSWIEVEKNDSIESLSQMEDSLRESLNRLRLQKENLGSQQLASLDFSTQFQNGLHLPMMFNDLQEAQQIPWLADTSYQHTMLGEGPSYIPQRDIGCSSDAAYSCFPSFFDTTEPPEINISGHIGSSGHNDVALNDMKNVHLQLNDPFWFPSYSSIDLPNEKEFKHESEINLQGVPADYQVPANNSYALSEPILDTRHHSWVPPFASCAVPKYDETSYQQHPH